MISLLAAAALASSPPIYPNLHNGDFSHGTDGWNVDQGYPFTGGERHARLLAPGTAPAGSTAMALQKVDATPWRGRTVELTAKVRLRAGAAGIRLAAYHADPVRRLVRSVSPMGTLKPDGKWHVIRVHGRAASDADFFYIGLYGVGASDVDFDDVRLAPYTPPNRPMTAHASEVLTRALDEIHKLHLNARGNPRWPEMAAQARRDAGGAQTTADLAPAITALLGDLNEHHAALYTPEDQLALTAEQGSSDYPRPSVTLADGGIGIVTLPAINLSQEADVEPAKAYIHVVRTGLETIDKSPLCGWIVDLRGDSGGTTHVMASAVAGLARFDFKDWPDEYDDYFYKTPIYSWIAKDARHDLKQGGKPVAVLIDGQTGSAGEDTALRFAGRKPTRSFGSPSGGFTSSNERVELADGYVLNIPSLYMHDRNGNPAKDRVMPDEQTDDPVGAAKKWLAYQCK